MTPEEKMKKGIDNADSKLFLEGVKEAQMRKKRHEGKLSKFYDAPFIEDTAEPYTGYKKLLINEGNLTSYHNGVRWPTGGLEATCSLIDPRVTLSSSAIFGDNPSPKHNLLHVPHPDCSCGIYAYSKLDTRVMNHFAGAGYSSAVVEIKMGGFLLPYTQGYRSQFAKISAIYIPDLKSDMLHFDFQKYTKIKYHREHLRQIAAKYKAEVRESPLASVGTTGITSPNIRVVKPAPFSWKPYTP